MHRRDGQIVEFTVERRDRSNPKAAPAKLQVYQRAELLFIPDDSTPDDYDKDHLLGLTRRPCVGAFGEPGYPAEKAGFKIGDVIESWEGIPNPTRIEIISAIQKNADRPNRAVVERDGQSVSLTVKPKRPFKLLGKAEDAKVGIIFGGRPVDDRPVVACVVPGTPAYAAFGPLRGFTILRVDNRETPTWSQVVDALVAASGKKTRIEYQTGDQIVTTEMNVPGSLITEARRTSGEAGLPRGAEVMTIDGQEKWTIKDARGVEQSISVRGSLSGLAKILATRVGQTVTVTYRKNRAAPIEHATFAVTADNLDPWQGRIVYHFDERRFEILKDLVSANGNPWTALVMSAHEVKRIAWQVYQSMVQLLQRKVSTEAVAGPIGIVTMGMQHAETSISDLLVFLAMLSVNLAILNLLPIPILDGGHLIFLLIEKIKGRPVSFNVRLYTGLAGLAVILLIGLFVTIQDIGRLF
jgi:regulator of sigma E protease